MDSHNTDSQIVLDKIGIEIIFEVSKIKVTIKLLGFVNYELFMFIIELLLSFPGPMAKVAFELYLIYGLFHKKFRGLRYLRDLLRT